MGIRAGVLSWAAAAAILAGSSSCFAGGHGHCHGGGSHFSFGLNFAPAPYYRYPAYAYPAYAYPAPYAYPYAYPAYYPVAAAPPVYQYAAQPAAPQPALATTTTWQAARPQGTIDIRLPEAQGEVWVDGQKVGGGGIVRTFRPGTAADTSHIYKITAAWHDRGRLVTEERVVDLAAGANTNVDFTRPEQTAAAKASNPQ